MRGQLRCHSEPRLETTVSEICRSHEIQMAPIISDFCHCNSRTAMHKHGLTPICRRAIFPSTNVPQAWCLWALCSRESSTVLQISSHSHPGTDPLGAAASKANHLPQLQDRIW